MENKIRIDEVTVKSNRITCKYNVSGEWSEAFKVDEPFYVEYSCDISNVPKSVAVIPLLANLLPVAWVYDAEIFVPVCDKDFYNSINDFKKGYEEMYPMIHFGGKIIVSELQENFCHGRGSAAFFSGGVDAFNTLVQHADEHPTLLTIWGADVQFEDMIGWERVLKHLQKTAEDFKVDFVTIKSSFRRFLNINVLTKKVSGSGDNWWHGFQHGIGIISHAAPVMYTMKKKVVYFASSFTIADKGKVTCASDPTIDNYVRFCGTNVHHDGYEFTRQMKIHNIVQFSYETQKDIQLRVCWQSSGGSNCCNCEKCWRTMLGLYIEGVDPKEFGFDYDEKQLRRLSSLMRSRPNNFMRISTYRSLQADMKKNHDKYFYPKEIRWVYNINPNKFGRGIWYVRLIRKTKKFIRNLR